MRKTKIICTMGPACSDEKTIEQLCKSGMNVARLNFSHNDHATYKETIDIIKKVREKLSLPIAILLDTKGPEYRIGTFKDNKTITLNEGDKFTFTTENIEGDEHRVSVSYKDIVKELNKGDIILLNNGLMRFRVESTEGTEIYCVTEAGGPLSGRKSMSFPDKVLKQKYLSEQDKEDILFGLEQGVDFIACSFVSCRQDMDDIIEFLNKNKREHMPELIAKIENRAGIENIEEICSVCSGIMIGRGDMGVEIPFEELPRIQKELITKCRFMGKRVITATEMLESMITNIRPTRAEISDIANAVYDGTSAIMLSGETAAGKYPVEALETMSKIAEQTEKSIHYAKRFRSADFTIKNSADAISHATCTVSHDIGAAAIAVCTHSGITARMVSRFRPAVDIYGIATGDFSWRRLALSWGVTPLRSDKVNTTEELFETVKNTVKNCANLKSGDKIVVTGGTADGKSGNTNMLKIIEI